MQDIKYISINKFHIILKEITEKKNHVHYIRVALKFIEIIFCIFLYIFKIKNLPREIFKYSVFSDLSYIFVSIINYNSSSSIALHLTHVILIHYTII